MASFIWKTVLCVLLVPVITVLAKGSCREARMCCTGRDSSCVVQKTPINAIIEDLSDKPCYCDHACMKLGDCCEDFKEACGVIDCRVSEWEVWSDCDVDCGAGMMQRTRSVIQQPQNGGKHCPTLIQKRGCHGNKCKHGHKSAFRETALILPAQFSDIRRANESSDIRKNLRLRYPKDPTKESSKEYCVEFEVAKASKACRKLNDEASLTAGNRVCVSCESHAFRKHLGYHCSGHGVEQKMTRFLSLLNCHGKWKRIQLHDTCPCKAGPDFIFV